LKWAAEQKVSLLQAIGSITQASAQVLGISGGDLSINSDADLCVFDANEYWKVCPDLLKSQGKNTPFTGLELAGKVKLTFVHGQVVYQQKT